MTSLKQAIDNGAIRRYKTVVFGAIVTVYMLFLVGGIVRATGAGMGCPDWPRCFGSWIPPTDIAELPVNYKEIYGAKLKGEVIFNPVKTWIEYVNRLFGVFTGMWIFATVLAAIPLLRRGKSQIFYLSLLALVLVAFQGWLGAKVVSSELHPVIITLHMLLAIVIVFILLYTYARVSHADSRKIGEWKGDKRRINRLVYVVIGLSVLQIVIGTQVREAMDHVVMQLGYEARSSWIDALGPVFLVHRSFSILLLAGNLWLLKRLHDGVEGGGVLGRLMRWIVGILVLTVVSGIVLNYWSVPAAAQPVHLTLATLMLGVQFVLWLFLNADRVFSKE